MHKRLFIGKRDLMIIGGVLVLSFFALLLLSRSSGDGGVRAQISLNGEVVMTVSLEEDRIFSIPQRPYVHLEVRSGRCAFVFSDCPDRICVNTGFLQTPGQAAACLPNRMVLRIVEDREDAEELDAIVR